MDADQDALVMLSGNLPIGGSSIVCETALWRAARRSA
jgi:hypothetical protein